MITTQQKLCILDNRIEGALKMAAYYASAKGSLTVRTKCVRVSFEEARKLREQRERIVKQGEQA